jgi:hypothetical protein
MLPRSRQLLLGAGPAAVAKVVPSVPMPGEVVSVPALVAKKAKVSKEGAPAMLDESTIR